MKKIILLVAYLFFSFSYAQPGSLDLTFSEDGKDTPNVGSPLSGGYAIATSGDKIYIGGYTATNDNTMTVIRYNDNGTLDQTFGVNGVVQTAFPDSSGLSQALCYSLAVQPDGKVVAGGYAFSGNKSHIALARYNTDGTLDDSFGQSGKVLTSTSYETDCFVVKIQADGKILAGGRAIINNTIYMLVARYHVNGALDNSFGNGGMRLLEVGDDSNITGLAVLPDGKILVSGDAGISGFRQFYAARLTTDGSFDPEFGVDGVAKGSTTGDTFASGLVILEDQSMIIGGYVMENDANMPMLAKVQADGSINQSFGTNGRVVHPMNGNDNVFFSIAAQSDGKIIGAGMSNANGQPTMLVSRFLQSGAIDSAFGTNGNVFTNFDDSGAYAGAVTVQNSGKIIVAGGGLSASTGLVAARYVSGVSLGTDDHSLSELSIAPNPLNSSVLRFSIASNERVTIDLIDITGQKLLSVLDGQLSGAQQISLSALDGMPSGLYFIRVATKFANRVLKVSK